MNMLKRILPSVLFAAAVGCSSAPRAAAPDVSRDRVAMQLDQNPPSDLVRLVETAPRKAFRELNDPVAEDTAKVVAVVQGILRAWDRIPRTSVYYIHRAQYSDLRATIYKQEGEYLVALWKDQWMPQEMALIVEQRGGTVLLVNPYPSPSD